MAITKPRERILVIGGGFAGLEFCKNLSGDRTKKVILLDRMNHHMFQPLFYQVACGRIEPSNISFPFRKIFQTTPNVQFRMTVVESIDPVAKTVTTPDKVFRYDRLVIATGCRTNFFGNAELAGKAYGMKTTQEAINIRNQVLMTFERMIIERKSADDGDWNLVIVGSGPTGVELAGAFAEMKNDILPRDYPRMNFSDLKIILISATPKPLAVMSEPSQIKSEEYLKDLGVQILYGDKVTHYDGQVVTMGSGNTIPSNNVIWAAGVVGNVIPGLPDTAVVRNRYVVDRYNQIQGVPDVFAIGDISYMETPKYPQGHPQVANVAINQGKNLAKNLKKKAGERWVEYEYEDLGSMATIGKHRAVVDLPNLKFQGRLAWYFWMFLHLMLILTVRNKLAIFFNWTWSYFNRDSSLRLIIPPAKKTH